jgi:hypothetical protein
VVSKREGDKLNSERLALLPYILDKYKNKLQIDINEGSIEGLRKCANHKGYLTINFWHEGKSKYYRVHEVIAYLGGLDLLNKTVNHINGNKTDNRLSNLEAVTAIENHRKAKDTNSFLTGERNHKTKLTQSEVDEIRRVYKGDWGEQARIAKEYGVDPATISNIVLRKTWPEIPDDINEIGNH